MPRLLPTTLVVLLGVSSWGCTKKERATKPPAFQPGKLVRYEEPELGFSILKPENVNATRKGNRVEFAASGFPTVVVEVHETEEIGEGSYGERTGDSLKWTVLAPKRKLVCRGEDLRDYLKLVDRMCASLKNTKMPPRNPTVHHEVKVEGAAADPKAIQQLFAGRLPKIASCWKAYLAKHPKKPISGGSISATLVYGPDGKRRSRSVTATVGGAQEYDELLQCANEATENLALPGGKAEVTVDWNITLKVY